MKKYLFFLLTVLLLASCGEDKHHFKLSGRLLQMNQGEFYIYSDDASIDGIDTIKVEGGRFSYEMKCEHPVTLTLVFPNFSEQPIFAEPGKSATIDGDASHLKMMKVKGTKNNELMSKFREQIANASPPEIIKYAVQFIEDHADTPIGVWLVKKYFVASPNPDYNKAMELIQVMKQKQPQNGALNRLAGSIRKMKETMVGSSLPSFTAYDMNGNAVTSSSLSSGTAVIITFATWSYNSTDMMRQLQDVYQNKGIKVVAFSVDASKYDCRNNIKMNQISFPVVCTGELFDTKPLSQLGMLTVPDNIVLQNGKIVARDLSTQDLMNRLNH